MQGYHGDRTNSGVSCILICMSWIGLQVENGGKGGRQRKGRKEKEEEERRMERKLLQPYNPHLDPPLVPENDSAMMEMCGCSHLVTEFTDPHLLISLTMYVMIINVQIRIRW